MNEATPWADDKRLNGPPHCDRCGKLCTADDCTYVGGHCDGYYHQSCWDTMHEPPGVLRVIAKYAAGGSPKQPS